MRLSGAFTFATQRAFPKLAHPRERTAARITAQSAQSDFADDLPVRCASAVSPARFPGPRPAPALLLTLPSPSLRARSNKRTRILRGARQRSSLPASAPSTVAPLAAALGGRFRVPADEVARLLVEHGVGENELLDALITPASALARTPISSFNVGAVGVGTSGTLYVGVNLEFARLPLYNSVHAEQFMLVNALLAGERGIKTLAVSAAPCGHCRQFFSELSCAETVKFRFNNGSYSLGRLLPQRFKPADLLGDRSTPLLLANQNNRLQFTPEAAARVASMSPNTPLAAAAAKALKKARESYSPYSRCPAGAAVVAADAVYSGGYIESAAYNPSMPPLQTAIIDAVIGGVPSYSGVEEVVVVELADGPVAHAPTVRVILEHIAPGARLTVLEAEWEEGAGPGAAVN